jgi:hypothetical protein
MDQIPTRVNYERDFHAKRYAAKKSFAHENNVPVNRVRLADGALSIIPDEEYKQILERIRKQNKLRKENSNSRRDARISSLEYDMWARAKRRAMQSGIEFNIEPSDIYIPGRCPVFNENFVYTSKENMLRPSLDRIDNSRGYVKGNIQVISFRANKLKGDATFKEVEMLYLWLKAMGLASSA